MNLLTPRSTIINWFDRCCGNWVSYRRYLYFSSNAMVEPHAQGIRTEFTTGKHKDDSYFVSWESVNEDGSPSSAGTMNFVIAGNRFSQTYKLVRDRAYFQEQTTESIIQVVDTDTLVFNSAYGGNHYREEIRFLSGDSIRLRQTVGFSDRDLKHRLCGQYMEIRQ